MSVRLIHIIYVFILHFHTCLHKKQLDVLYTVPYNKYQVFTLTKHKIITRLKKLKKHKKMPEVWPSDVEVGTGQQMFQAALSAMSDITQAYVLCMPNPVDIIRYVTPTGEHVSSVTCKNRTDLDIAIRQLHTSLAMDWRAGPFCHSVHGTYPKYVEVNLIEQPIITGTKMVARATYISDGSFWVWQNMETGSGGIMP